MSTYPKGAFTLNGGCNCKSIRYTLEFPPEGDRVVSLPADKSNGQGEIRMPQSAVCFCNDCRIAGGSLALFALLCPPEHINFSFVSKSNPDSKRLDISATEAFTNPPVSPVGEMTYLGDTHFGLYQSSEKAIRAFCSKCGTPMMYIYTPRPLPPGATSGGIDMYLGTLDREDLEKMGGLDRFVNCKLGIDWVKKLFVKESFSKGTAAWHDGTDMAELI